MSCVCRFVSELIDYIFRDKKIESKIYAYRNLPLKERSDLHNLLSARSKTRELKLLIYQVLVVYSTGTSQERENIESWLKSIGAIEALGQIQRKFVSRTLNIKF